jgi:hypothetical protein
MAKHKKQPPSFPRAPLIPDDIWLPFVISLTGDRQHDNRAIASLAYILDLDPEAIKFRLKEELADRPVLQAEPTLH